MFLERESERDALEAALAATLDGTGRFLVVTGPTGIGRTAFVDEALPRAAELGLSVWSATASALEQDFPYGVALRIFEEITQMPEDESDKLFAGHGEMARPLLRPTVDHPVAARDAPATAYGLFNVVRGFAGERPLLVAVDDVQWADNGSLQFLTYLAERIAGVPVCLLVTALGTAWRARGTALPGLVHHQNARHLSLDALSPSGVERLTRSVFPAAGDDFCDEMAHLTRGIPLLVREHLVALDLEGLDPVSESLRQIREGGVLEITRATSRRLRLLDAETRSLMEALTILDGEATLEELVPLANLTWDEATDAAGSLVDTMLVETGAASQTLRVLDPSVCMAVQESIDTPRRSRLHRRAARLAGTRRSGAMRAARHLLKTTPGRDAWVAETLWATALHAIERGAHEAAAQFLRRALHEPPSEALRPRILEALGRAEAIMGEPDALDHLEEASKSREGEAGADHTTATGYALLSLGRYRDSALCFDEALETALHRRGARGLLDAAFLIATVHDPTARDAFRERLAAVLAQKPSEDDRALLATQAWGLAMTGTDAPTVRAMARAALGGLVNGGNVALNFTEHDDLWVSHAVSVLLTYDDLSAAVVALSHALDQADRQGARAPSATFRVLRAQAHYHMGALEDAVHDLDLALSAPPGWTRLQPEARALLAHVRMHECDMDAASALLDPDPSDADAEAEATTNPDLEVARATHAMLSRGDLRTALAHLMGAAEAGRGLEPEGGRAVVASWRLVAATALNLLGNRTEALEMAVKVEQSARRVGARLPLAEALCVVGTVRAGSAGISALREAVEILSDSDARLLEAGVLAELGSLLVREDARGARAVLEQAHRVALDCGSSLLEARVAREFADLQQGPVGPSGLTPAEWRVMELARASLTNREIAERLFVSIKAVEWHLTNIYGKLGIRSRRELPAVVEPATGTNR